MKLDVGCGNRPRRGYVGIDKFSKRRSTIKAEAHSLPFYNGEVSAINCSHMIEHLYDKKVTTVLQEFYRVLKVNGKLEISCPDFERMVEMWIEGDYKYRWGIGLIKIFGWQRYPGDFHYTGFSKKRIKNILQNHGFEVVKIENRPSQAKKEVEQFPDGDLYVEAYKI